MGLSSPAFGDTIDWTNSGANQFDNGINWTTSTGTGTVPGAGDSAHIFPGFTTAADPSNSDIAVSPGGPTTITINTTNNHTLGSLLVSSNFDSTTFNGTLNLNFNGGSTLTVGALAVFTGGVTVNYSGNYASPGGTLIVGTSTSTIDPGQVTGPATLNLTAGTVNMDGPGALLVGQAETGTVNQNIGSVVIAPGSLKLGTGGGTGTYNLTAGSTLDIGTVGSAPALGSYDVQVGSGTNSTGTLTVMGGSTLNATNAGTTFEVADGTGTNGTVTQNASTVNMGATSVQIGAGGTGLYQLQSGALNIQSPTSTTTATHFFHRSKRRRQRRIGPERRHPGRGPAFVVLRGQRRNRHLRSVRRHGHLRERAGGGKFGQFHRHLQPVGRQPDGRLHRKRRHRRNQQHFERRL